MRRRTLFLALACVFALSAAATAATWNHVGTVGFTKQSPSQFQDRQRVILNSMVFDEAGNLWVAASYDDQEIAPAQGLYAHGSGVSVFKAGSMQRVDVDVKALGFDGCVTKLVVSKLSDGGDGNVYALQNYLNIEWSAEITQNRILKLELNPDNTISVVQVYTPGTVAIWATPAHKLGGLAAGSDGKLYFTQNGVNSYWKYHFFWRYDPIAGTAEEAPNRDGVTIECGSETHRMLDLEYLGNEQFAIVGAKYNNDWQCSPISWTEPWAEYSINLSKPGWGRKWNTANAYDPIRRKMWAGGRSEIAYVDWNKFPADPGATIVDLGGGNKGLRIAADTLIYNADMKKNAKTHKYYSDKQGIPGAATSAVFRLRVDSYDTDRTIIWIYPNSSKSVSRYGMAASLQIIGGRYKLHTLVNATTPELADLGPVVPGEWNEFWLYIDSETATCQCKLNGSMVYNGPLTYSTGKGWIGWIEWGDLTAIENDPGSSITTWDYVYAGAGLIPPSELPSKYYYYNDGSVLPHRQYQGSHIMSYWYGNPANPTIFDPMARTVEGSRVWHANSYDELGSPQPGVRLGGMYWVSAMAVNPYTGEPWIAYGAEPSYGYEPTDRVYTLPASISSTKPTRGDEGAPEAGAQVTNLLTRGDRMYALTCNLTTGVYNVYSAEMGSVPPGSVSQIKSYRAGALVTTDAPKVVTYPAQGQYSEFFYIEDEGRTGGIRVYPAGPEDARSAGDKVSVSGILDVINMEACIANATVSGTDTGSVEPVAMTTRSAGGGAGAVQPAVIPSAGLSTIGLLVRVAGVLEQDYDGWYLDDGSGYKLRVDWYNLPWGTNNVIITGVLAVDPVDTTEPPDGKPDEYRAVLLVRSEDDIQVLP